MGKEVSQLEKILHFDTKFKATHDFSGQVLPFFTRNPERVKYTNGFTPIIGVIARVINHKNPELNSEFLESNKIAIDTQVNDAIVDRLFSARSYQGMPSSKLLQYLPLSMGKERVGEIRLGQFLIDLLGLKGDEQFVQRFQETDPANLYERVVFNSLKMAESSKKTEKREFKFYNKDYYQKLFNQDAHRLMQDQGYFYNHVADLIKFYYFTYVTQTIIRMSDAQVDQPIIPLYFALEDESVSRSRGAVRRGYSLVYQHGQDLLTDVDVLNYLNTLIGDQSKFYWKNQILAPDFPYAERLLENLNEFLPLLAKQLDNTATTGVSLYYSNLQTAVNGLRTILSKRNEGSRETSSRYAKSFEEIAQQGYIRQHGRLGRTFSLNNNTVLMLTTAIVGKGKAPLNDVFKALQECGIFFDRITRDKVINLFEQANILEKLSDSGDAQYVQGIL